MKKRKKRDSAAVSDADADRKLWLEIFDRRIARLVELDPLYFCFELLPHDFLVSYCVETIHRLDFGHIFLHFTRARWRQRWEIRKERTLTRIPAASEPNEVLAAMQ